MKTHSPFGETIRWFLPLLLIIAPGLPAAETVGARPYEMVWIGRTNDHCAPLVDFEYVTGWRVECKGANP